MQNNYKIIYIGTPLFSVPILESLITNNYKPVVVITEPDRSKGRKKILTPPPIKLVAQKNKILVLQPNKIIDYKSQITSLKPDLIIVAAYGQIIPQEILDIPKLGALNIHPSLLPLYRGASPIQNTILNNEVNTGTTIIKMDAKMDHGDIITHSNLSAQGEQISNVTYPELAEKLSNLSAKLLIDILPKYFAGKIRPLPQDHSKATFTKLLKKEDGLLADNEKPEIVERKIRAYYPWPGTYFLIDGTRFIVKKAYLEQDLVVIEQIQPEGKKIMSFKDFSLGYKDLLTKLPKWVKI
jgi:methionyl-tRNA formyltransferase